MQLAVTGAHGTGKTTLINKINELNLLPSYHFSTNLTRKLVENGFIINQNGDDETQKAIMTIHKANIAYTDIIMDRCALDCYVYTEYLYRHGKVCTQTHNEMFIEMLNCISCYTKIFYLKPEFEIEDDGLRSIDTEFQDEIAEIFADTISQYRIRVTSLTGSVDQRIETFKQTLGI